MDRRDHTHTPPVADGLVRRWRDRVAVRTTLASAFWLAGIVMLHAWLSTSPVWMVAVAMLLPAAYVAAGVMAVADRWRQVPAPTESSDVATADDSYRSVPKWMVLAEGFVIAAIVGWFGDSWESAWHRAYPKAPSLLIYLAIISLSALASVILEATTGYAARPLRRGRRPSDVDHHESPHS